MLETMRRGIGGAAHGSFEHVAGGARGDAAIERGGMRATVRDAFAGEALGNGGGRRERLGRHCWGRMSEFVGEFGAEFGGVVG